LSKETTRFLLGMLLSVGVPLALFLGLKGSPHLDHLVEAPAAHFQVVTVVSLLATGIAAAAGMAGYRLRNIQVTLLSLAFTSLAVIFALHGLATPGFVLPASPVPGIAAQLSLLVASFWLWLSAFPSTHPLVAWLARWQRLLVPTWITLLALLDALLLLNPELAALIPLNISPLKWPAMVVTLVMTILAASHYWRAFRYSRFPLQAAILHSTAWLAVAQVIITTGELWRTSWWTYHFLLLGAVVLMAYGLVRQYRLGSSLATAVQGLFATDPAVRIEAGIGPAVRALVVATERHDPYTAGHSYRVALYALHLGQAMNLPPERLRALAQGAVLHDIGKIRVPESILNKPGKLTLEERAMIEQHPVNGFDMGRVLGFMQDELDVIRSHHEKWDGTGYPDRLAGEQIPFLGRILALADVYDALTSKRSYRQAWSHQEAMGFIAEHAGTHFDPQCVAVWNQVMARQLRIDRYPDWLQEAARTDA